MVAIVKSSNSQDGYCTFDSHARNSMELPDQNGAAVLMSFSTLTSLKSHIFDVASQLSSYEFEIVPITFQGNHMGKGKYNQVASSGEGKRFDIDKITGKS